MEDDSLGARPKIYKAAGYKPMEEDPPAEVDGGGGSEMDRGNVVVYTVNVSELPDEVLEYIFKLISPYADFQSCYRVCRRWRDCCERVVRSRLLNFHNQLNKAELEWTSVHTDESPGNIGKRYSHCSVYYPPSHSMFVFGGCTCSSSTFNDLWQFDLSSRIWSRVVSMGTYPSPKALASMVEHGSSLILFGGWTHPSPYPLHQTWKLFSELHIFNIKDNKWNQLCARAGEVWPPPSAGHSATVHRNNMVVFGGLQKQREVGFFSSSNNIWVFSVLEQTWRMQPVLGESKPGGRYGQSQIYIDEFHLLILGGCEGPQNSELSDIWLLQMKDSGWKWVEMNVEGSEHRGKDIWRHPACRAAPDRVVVLGKSKVVAKKPNSSLQIGVLKFSSVPAPHHATRNAIGSVPRSSRNVVYNNSSSSEENEPTEGRGREGPRFQDVRRFQDGARGLEVAGPSRGLDQRFEGLEREISRVPVKPRQKMMETRQRQLASLNKMEERIRNSRVSSSKLAPASSPPVLCPNHRMALSVLDTSRAVTHHTVRWLEPSPLPPGSEVPQECILYTLVKGRTELILFGGLKRDISLSEASQSSVSNSLHILYPYSTKI